MPRPSAKAMRTKPCKAIWHTTLRGEPIDVEVTIEYATVDRAWFRDPVKGHRTYGKWYSQPRPALGVHTQIELVDKRLEFLSASGASVSDLAEVERPIGLAILRYNVVACKLIGAKTKPAPWMHLGIIKTDKEQNKFYWAIWVWDTREVIEEGTADMSVKDQVYDISTYANDNRMQLKGTSRFAELFLISISKSKRQFK